VKYTIEIERLAKDFLASLSLKKRRQVGKKIDLLGDNPRPPTAKKIKGCQNIWRIRSGDFRIAYTVKHDKLLVLVIHIGDRKDFYRYFN